MNTKRSSVKQKHGWVVPNKKIVAWFEEEEKKLDESEQL